MQINRSCQSEIWNGSSSALETRSIRMAQEPIEPRNLGTGKQQAKIGELSVSLQQLDTARHWFSIAEELLSGIEQIG